MTRYGMIIDLDRCNGCNSCTVACKATNATQPGVFWGFVLQKETGRTPNVTRLFLPVLCNHCANPSCVDVCPTGASYMTEQGLVLIDALKCVGCKTCMTACPYGIRWYIEEEETYYPGITIPAGKKVERPVKTVQKCDFCAERIKEADVPKCVEVCPTYARIFGDLEDPDSELSKLRQTESTFALRSEAGTDPTVRYIQHKKLY